MSMVHPEALAIYAFARLRQIEWGYVSMVNSGTIVYLPISATPVSVVMNDDNNVANDLSISTCSYTS